MIRGVSGLTVLLLLAVLFIGGLVVVGQRKPVEKTPLTEAQDSLRDTFGFSVEPVPPPTGGLPVIEVVPDQLAQRVLHLKVGDVVVAVNESSVWHSQNLLETLDRAWQQGAVRIMVKNKDVYRTVILPAASASSSGRPAN